MYKLGSAEVTIGIDVHSSIYMSINKNAMGQKINC